MKCVEEPITGEYKYKGVIVDVRLDKARLVNGKVVNREVVEHPGGVGILPLVFRLKYSTFISPWALERGTCIPMKMSF